MKTISVDEAFVTMMSMKLVPRIHLTRLFISNLHYLWI